MPTTFSYSKNFARSGKMKKTKFYNSYWSLFREDKDFQRVCEVARKTSKTKQRILANYIVEFARGCLSESERKQFLERLAEDLHL